MPFLFCLPGPAAQRRRTAAPSAVRKTRAAAPRLIAPPAAPAAAPTAPAAPAAPAAGRPRTAKARAVWQPHRARPRRKILLLAARRDPSPRPSHFRAQSGQPHKNWAAPDRAHRPSPAVKTIRQQRPRPKTRAPRPYGRGARSLFVRFVPSSSMSRSAQSQRQAPHDRQNNSARPSARHIAAQSPVSHTPRHAAPPAAPQKTLGPAAMPGAPPRPATKIVLLVARRAPSPRLPRRREKSGQTPDRMHPVPKHAPPPIRAGARSPFVRFVPSSSMSRSAQSQEPRRTIAGAAARPHVKRRAGA